VIGDADGVSDDGEGGVDRSAAGKETGVDDVEVVEVVGLAVEVENRLRGLSRSDRYRSDGRRLRGESVF